MSKAIERIEERQASLEPGSLRYEALEAAKRFKTSWVELGRMMWTVYKDKKYREWGYLSFEAYCAKEVGIREATAKKLLHSYFFLEKEEPTILKQLTEDPPAQLPNVDSVNMLRLLNQKQGAVSPEGYQKVRSYVLEKGKEAPEVRREVRSLMEAQVDPAEARESRRSSSIRRMIGTLKGMSQEFSAGKLIPGKLLTEIDSLIKKLEELL